MQNGLTLAVLVLGPLYSDGSIYFGRILIGAILFVAGAIVGILGVRALGSNRTHDPLPLPGGELIESGVFAYVRHPLYCSLILSGVGWSTLFGSIPAVMASVGLAILLDRKARLEERYLRERFPTYSAYARRVTRFVPGIY
jgi:protein-S-isoprenylcysteine O-methyltransferase Ste14